MSDLNLTGESYAHSLIAAGKETAKALAQKYREPSATASAPLVHSSSVLQYVTLLPMTFCDVSIACGS